ncbi:MAG: DUF6465 family protein [Oscillospiraceae bacterium]|nr:DUF6465 family protein [Oscillospiraceae bacterium]
MARKTTKSVKAEVKTEPAKEVKTEPAKEVKTEPVKEVKTEPVKEVAVESAQEVKAEKTTAKKATVKKSENVYIQHNGKEVSVAELLDTAKKLSEVKSPKNVSLYVKPEDNAVYYVVDGETGKIDL